jgi:hypothetical protein
MSAVTLGTRTRPLPEPGMRLTARGRHLVAVAAIVLVLVAVGLVAVALARPVGADPGGLPAGTTTVVVGPGDSLWDIARAVAPAADPRAVVHEIERRNGVDAGSLHVGDELVVPAG